MEAAATPPPRYQQLADRIDDMIREGAFEPGERVPSLRRLARQMSVSLTTAMEAYRVLEDRGLLEARPQSGFYVRAPRRLPPAPSISAPSAEPVELDIVDLIHGMLDDVEDPSKVSFGAAVPHPDFLPIDALNRVLAREVRRNPAASQSYDSVRGHLPLRTQIARRALDAGCTLAPDEVITTAGAHQALYLALRAITAPGDTVAVESPTYMGLLQILENLGLRALEVATDPDDGICLDHLADALRRQQASACALVPTFGNPTGHSMPEAKRERLLEILDGYQVPLIEDDIYGDLHHDRQRPRAVKAFDRTGSVLLCSSFSKTLAPGYRVGWIAPGRFADAVAREKYLLSVATPTPTQMAIAAYVASGGYDRHLRRLRNTYRGLMARVASAVGEHFPDGTRVTHPRGGHVLWVEMPTGVDSLELLRRARRHGITFAPGPLFSCCGDYRHCLRLNCAVPWSETAADALATLGRLAARMM